MRKRIIITGFCILIILVYFFPIFSYAQEESIDLTLTLSPTPIPQQEQAPYELPYPGLLPDSPLYSLKVFRDRVISYLISDALKEAEFYFLQSDKRLSAGVALFEKGKFDLSEETISKGENYFEKGVAAFHKAQSQGQDTRYLQEKMTYALKKHTLVIVSLGKKAPAQKKVLFTELVKRLRQIEKGTAKSS